VRILYISDFPVLNTGYATVSRHLLRRLIVDYEVCYLPIAGPEHGAFSPEIFGAEVLPTLSSVNDISYWFFKKDCDVALILKDPYVFNGIESLPVFHVFYAPVAEEPLSPQYKAITQTAMYIWIPSNWGIRVAKESGIHYQRLRFVPHGVPSVYRILDEPEEYRKKFGFPDVDVMISMVSVNRGRKFVPNQLAGVKKFIENNPDLKVGIYLHMSMQPDNYTLHGGWDMGSVLDIYGLSGITRFPDPYLYKVGFSEQQMCELYNATDVLLNASTEGFGLPIIEAQACGTPVVTVKHGNGPEINFFGLNAEVGAFYHTIMGTMFAIPDPDSVAEQIERAIKIKDTNKRNVSDFVRKNYDWDVVYRAYIRKELDKIESEIDPRKVVEVIRCG